MSRSARLASSILVFCKPGKIINLTYRIKLERVGLLGDSQTLTKWSNSIKFNLTVTKYLNRNHRRELKKKSGFDPFSISFNHLMKLKCQFGMICIWFGHIGAIITFIAFLSFWIKDINSRKMKIIIKMSNTESQIEIFWYSPTCKWKSISIQGDLNSFYSSTPILYALKCSLFMKETFKAGLETFGDFPPTLFPTQNIKRWFSISIL